jgi:hypothetical protein
MPRPSGEAECTQEWPGTLPVLSPSGTEYECRCPGGHRWDEGSRACVAGAPVVVAAPGFYGDAAPPAAPRPAFPLPAAGPAPGAAPSTAPAARPPSSANCEGMLAEIRALAEAGQAGQADALGMKAAIAGCDPTAISDASRARPQQ